MIMTIIYPYPKSALNVLNLIHEPITLFFRSYSELLSKFDDISFQEYMSKNL